MIFRIAGHQAGNRCKADSSRTSCGRARDAEARPAAKPRLPPANAPPDREMCGIGLPPSQKLHFQTRKPQFDGQVAVERLGDQGRVGGCETPAGCVPPAWPPPTKLFAIRASHCTRLIASVRARTSTSRSPASIACQRGDSSCRRIDLVSAELVIANIADGYAAFDQRSDGGIDHDRGPGDIDDRIVARGRPRASPATS